MDILLREQKYRRAAAFISALACVLMVCLPETALLSGQKAISLWAGNVLPALMPFFICSNFMNNLGIVKALPTAAFAFSMSFMSGYPMGAKIIGDMGRKGDITPSQARWLISFCSTSGPSFILGAVGIGMLGNLKSGIIMGVCHYLGALFNGLFFSLFISEGEKKRIGRQRKKENEINGDILSILTDSILDSLKALGIILAYIVLFMFAADIMRLSGILNFIESDYIKAMVQGILEMTVGCSAMSFAPMEMGGKTVICTLLISFGGLSIIGQSLSMLSGSGVPPSYFLLTKVCHGLWAGLLSAAAVCIFL